MLRSGLSVSPSNGLGVSVANGSISACSNRARRIIIASREEKSPPGQMRGPPPEWEIRKTRQRLSHGIGPPLRSKSERIGKVAVGALDRPLRNENVDALGDLKPSDDAVTQRYSPMRKTGG